MMLTPMGVVQGRIRMAIHHSWRGVTPLGHPPQPTKVTIVGKNRNLQSGKSGRAIFGKQTFAPPPPPPPASPPSNTSPGLGASVLLVCANQPSSLIDFFAEHDLTCLG